MGYIKDYEGGTIMQCSMVPRVKYLEVNSLLQTQRKVLRQKKTCERRVGNGQFRRYDIDFLCLLVNVIGCYHQDQRSVEVAYHISRTAGFQKWPQGGRPYDRTRNKYDSFSFVHL